MDTDRQRDETLENYAARLRRMVLGKKPTGRPRREELVLCSECRAPAPVKRAKRRLYCVDCYPSAVGEE